MLAKKTLRELRNLVLVYLGAWFFALCFVLIVALANGRSMSRAWSLFLELIEQGDFQIGLHFVFILLYLCFLIVRYFIRVYRKKGRRTLFKRLALRLALPVALAMVLYRLVVYNNAHERFEFEWDASIENNSGKVTDHYAVDSLQRGMSVFGWGRDHTDQGIRMLRKDHVEWIAVIPFIYQKDQATKSIELPETEEWTRRDSLFIRAIDQLHASGFHVHLKPHLWTGSGWRSGLNPGNGSHWDAWFASYRTYMLRYAKMAEMTGAELLCVGTELKTSIKKQPEAWQKLIAEIREIYSGKLTYAANWHDEYEHIDFWKELDYIGIQAYFPLTKEKNPDLATIKKGWQRHIEAMETLYATFQRPILFTEVGYKSEASATIRPWEWGSFLSILTKKKSDRTQQLAYEALFEEVWHRPWFAGLYIWQWDNRSTALDAKKNLDFSPRFKPAENTMTKWFASPQRSTDHGPY
ncbi:MAG: hypothetical protein HRT65_13760 [Flavobacteriaceae bacterium]|nr:hypothetical protein [Flavobacteriaceae bacterium]